MTTKPEPAAEVSEAAGYLAREKAEQHLCAGRYCNRLPHNVGAHALVTDYEDAIRAAAIRDTVEALEPLAEKWRAMPHSGCSVHAATHFAHELTEALDRMKGGRDAG
jgi:hypothetical protein